MRSHALRPRWQPQREGRAHGGAGHGRAPLHVSTYAPWSPNPTPNPAQRLSHETCHGGRCPGGSRKLPGRWLRREDRGPHGGAGGCRGSPGWWDGMGTPLAEPPPRSRNHLRWVEAGPAQDPPGPTDQVPPASGPLALVPPRQSRAVTSNYQRKPQMATCVEQGPKSYSRLLF